MLKKALSLFLSVIFAGSFFIGGAAWADASPAPSADRRQASPSLPVKRQASLSRKPGNGRKGKRGGVEARGFYSSSSSSLPYSPFASKTVKARPSSLEAIPSSFGKDWSGEVLTFAANNLLNSSDPESPDSPEVTPQGVVSFLQGKGITIAPSAETEIENEVEGMINADDGDVGLINGAPLARIFSIQIIVMKNKSTGQLVYPSSFPESMTGKSWQDQYQASWHQATSGKTYTLSPTYIWNSLSYTASNVIWEDPSLIPPGTNSESDVYSVNYSLDQIESKQLSSMKVEEGKINSLNLIGITQRAYAIKTNLPSLSFYQGQGKKRHEVGYQESTGTDAGGNYATQVASAGSTIGLDFSVETGPGETSASGNINSIVPGEGIVATVTLTGAPNAYLNPSSFHVDQDGVLAIPDTSSSRTMSIQYALGSNLGAYTTLNIEVPVKVTAPEGKMAEVCAVVQFSSAVSDSGPLILKGQSSTQCFAVEGMSQNDPDPSTLYKSGTSSISMLVPGWAFQYNGDVVDTLWSTLKSGEATTLEDYEDAQPSLPKLDQYSVDADEATVTDLATGANVTSLFSPSFSGASSSNTGLPYSGPTGYGGYTLTPASLTVSWNGSWTGSAVGDPGLWGYGSTPIGYDMFEVTFPLTLSSSVGGCIYSQSSTTSSSATFSSSAPCLSTPLPVPAPPAVRLSEVGVKGSSGKIESSNITATLGVPMEFEAEAAFPDKSQISDMESSSYSLAFYMDDPFSQAAVKGMDINGVALSSLPDPSGIAEGGSVAVLLTSQDLQYLSQKSPNASDLVISYPWTVLSAPSHAVSEIGYVKASTLSGAGEPNFDLSPSTLAFTVNSNGTGPLTPNAKQSSALTGIWFQNQLLSGEDAKGAEFTVQNDTKGSQYYGDYLAPSSDGNPPYSYSPTPYDFRSTNGDGLFRMWGLADGTYTVKEAKLPEGAYGPMPSFKVALNWSSEKPSNISSSSPSGLVDASSFIVFNGAQEDRLPLTGGRLPLAFLFFLLPLLLATAGYAGYKAYKALK